MQNPFFYGNPVPPDQLVGRRQELRRIAGRIANQGQSTAVVGEPRTGKTSLLHYLAAPEKAQELYGRQDYRLFFSFLDSQTFDGRFDQAQFWRLALAPVYEETIVLRPDSALGQAYQVCAENHFGAYVLERLLAQM